MLRITGFSDGYPLVSGRFPSQNVRKAFRGHDVIMNPPAQCSVMVSSDTPVFVRWKTGQSVHCQLRLVTS